MFSSYSHPNLLNVNVCNICGYHTMPDHRPNDAAAQASGDLSYVEVKAICEEVVRAVRWEHDHDIFLPIVPVESYLG